MHMRNLLKKNVHFLWNRELVTEFETVKQLLTGELVVKPFDPELKTMLLTDASRLHGLGYALVQSNPDGSLRLIKCGSCALTPTQSRYATIELEALAIVWAIRKCTFYLYGIQHFTVVTDHNPLVGIFKKDVACIDNPRLQRFRLDLMGHTFSVEWKPGKTHAIADALSRRPVFGGVEEPKQEDYSAAAVKHVLGGTPDRIVGDTPIIVSNLIDICAHNEPYKEIIEAVKQGVDLRSLPPDHPARAFANVWDHLGISSYGTTPILVYDSKRIVIPHDAVGALLRKIHNAHQGIVKTRKLAQQLYYWPGMNNDIKQMVENCSACQRFRPSQPRERFVEQEHDEETLSLYPMAAVALDYFTFHNKVFLVMVDSYSGYPAVAKMRGHSGSELQEQLFEWFSYFGIPGAIRTDNGPPFNGHEWREFCNGLNIEAQFSSPYNSPSNGLAEAAVKNIKNLFRRDAEDDTRYNYMNNIAIRLLDFRNMPRADGLSPAEMFFGRRQRTSIPTIELGGVGRQPILDPHPDRHLAPLYTGQAVLIQDPHTREWSKHGRIVGRPPRPPHVGNRSYIVQTDDNQVLHRNRIFLRPDTTVRLGADADGENSNPPALQPADPAPPPEAPPLRRSPRNVHFAATLHTYRYFDD